MTSYSLAAQDAAQQRPHQVVVIDDEDSLQATMSSSCVPVESATCRQSVAGSVQPQAGGYAGGDRRLVARRVREKPLRAKLVFSPASLRPAAMTEKTVLATATASMSLRKYGLRVMLVVLVIGAAGLSCSASARQSMLVEKLSEALHRPVTVTASA
jgi:hypothetical protein